ncbi:MAG TPA: baseplate J/gp47 family protein [Gemmatimonadaceae bacterium]|jgi:hypothetical protein|nr:baseplate J/gp47 family protein [Gemmatimonadaceae bacterium]
MISLAQLLQATTKSAATQAILDIATALGFNVTSWQSNRAGRTLIAILATIYAGFTVVAVNFAAAGGYLSTAAAGWLRLLAAELFGVSWNPASYATGFVTLTSTAAVPYTFSPGGLTFTNPATKISYVNTYDAGIYGPLPGLATLTAGGTLTIPIQAIVPGSASNAGGGLITVVSPAFLGVTVSNVNPIIGTDDETDVALRARCEAKRGALAPNGAPGAYLYWAQSIRLDGSGNPVYPPPVSDQAAYDAAVPIDVNRVKVSINNPTGTVNVYLGGSGGAATGPVTTMVDHALQTYVVPAGITEMTGVAGGVGCFTTAISITYTAEIDPSFGVSGADAVTVIAAALASYFGDTQRNPIGAKAKVAHGQAYVYVKVLESVILGALPGAGLPPAIITADISMPASDIAINPDHLAVLSGAPLATITNVIQN